MSTAPTTAPGGEATHLNCSGLLCPLPVYKAGLALGRLAPGELLVVTTTDPGALEDIPAMTRQRGDELVSVDRQEGIQVFTIRKGQGR
jgi:tRNA 2-thiouridine synthesizing protein A